MLCCQRRVHTGNHHLSRIFCSQESGASCFQALVWLKKQSTDSNERLIVWHRQCLQRTSPRNCWQVTSCEIKVVSADVNIHWNRPTGNKNVWVTALQGANYCDLKLLDNSANTNCSLNYMRSMTLNEHQIVFMMLCFKTNKINFCYEVRFTHCICSLHLSRKLEECHKGWHTYGKPKPMISTTVDNNDVTEVKSVDLHV